MIPYQPIYDIATLCAKRGIVQAILCPGSRCAPLTLAFARHPDITTRTFSDERSAGFIALGIAQQTKVPSVLICTSGSAAYNLAPAVAEAFFNQTPLLIFTADRPSEWIGQHDGQTIYQMEIFGKHVKKFLQLPQDYEHADSQWAINRIVNEAINLSLQEPKGPVHINAPFREPLYPTVEAGVNFSDSIRVMEEFLPTQTLTPTQIEFIANHWADYSNILIVAGQHEKGDGVIRSVSECLERHSIPLVGDIISNLHSIEATIKHADVFLAHAPDGIKKTLRPDLLITFGKSTISKNLKTFLRKYKPTAHWHIQPAGAVADTFQSITTIFNVDPNGFFEFLCSINKKEIFEEQKQRNYQKFWEVEERRASRILNDFFPHENFGELEMVYEIINNLPGNCTLHLANSMSVRYANLVGLNIQHKNIKVYSNRGTSGIDGCTSSVVGHALVNKSPHVLITGDLAFFYDRNAFWHNYAVPNLRVVVLNNHGGIIFKMIDGPGDLPESDEYFVTKQKLTAKNLAEEVGFDYIKLDHKRKLKNLVRDFFEFEGRTKILEFESEIPINHETFQKFKTAIKKSYES